MSAPHPQPRILLLQTQAENGGAQEIARILGHGLSERGFDVHFGFFYRRTGGYDVAPGVFFGSAARPNGAAGTLAMMRNLHRHIRALNPDAVLTFQHYGNIIGAGIARLAGVGPVIANLNTPLSALPYPIWAADWLFSATRLYSCTVANSASTEAEFRALPPPFEHRMVRIDHGFEPKLSTVSKAEARAALQLPASAVLLGMVGRLHPQKNQSALLAMLPANATWHLALAGQGGERAVLEAQARRLGCADRVHFVGELPSDRVGMFLRALDAFVFPSLHETFGLAPVEAANNGIPVICNDLPTLREVLSVDGEPCARFAPVSDPSAFAAAVREVLADPALAIELAERGRRLRDKYSLVGMVDAYVALLGHHGVTVR